MAGSKKSALLSSLAAYGDDSEPESEPETGEQEAHGGLVSAGYGDDEVSRVKDGEENASENEDSDENDRNSEEDDSESGEPQDELKVFGCPSQFSEKVRNMSPEEIRIPPEPPGRCPGHLQEKIYKLYERKLHGDFDTNSHIQKKKEFRNPSIYEKLIQYCGIDELGTNYPKDMFDSHGWSEDSYYESLGKFIKNRLILHYTHIEFVTGTKKGTTTSTAAVTTSTTTATSTEAQKRKSKWDSAVPVTLAQPALLTTTATLPGVVSVTTTASGTKTTVISAVGTILKKAKQ
uniref:SAP30 binding protein n=1 Tax=Astyanax mexicanus TaxID=7994 RepID=W5L483_ASTMX